MDVHKSVRKVPEHALRPGAQKKFSYNIEIVGTCNLRCPSCPVGNMGRSGRPNGLMDPVVFENILKKIAIESPGKNTRVAVFDWGEPTLHPELPRLIELIHQYGFRSRVSSNLNLGIRLDPIVKANPDEFHISLSGYYQANYSQTHAGGDVERVKENIRLLSRLKAQYGARTAFLIGFHAYRHNIERDLPAMRRLADEVGFNIEPVVAHFYPLEKSAVYLAQHHGEEANVPGVEISTKDRKLVDLLLVKPEQNFPLRRPQAKDGCDQDCSRRAGKMSIRLDGSVPLCCGTYDRRFTATESFLETPHDEIQLQRYNHDFCGTCMRHGLHLAPVGIRQRLANRAIGESRLAALARWILGAKERLSVDEEISDPPAEPAKRRAA